MKTWCTVEQGLIKKFPTDKCLLNIKYSTSGCTLTDQYSQKTFYKGLFFC